MMASHDHLFAIYNVILQKLVLVLVKMKEIERMGKRNG